MVGAPTRGWDSPMALCPGKTNEAAQPAVPIAAPAPHPPVPPGTPCYPHSITFHTIPAAPCLPAQLHPPLPPAHASWLSPPNAQGWEMPLASRYLAPSSPPQDVQGPDTGADSGWPPGAESGQRGGMQGEMLFAPLPFPTGMQRSKQDGHPRQAHAWHGPPKCQPCRAVGPGSAQYRSPPPMSPIPSPLSARPQPGGTGVVGEARVGRREVPPRAPPPHPAAPARSPGSLAASDGTYGATATSAAAAAHPPYATSLCSCLDSLITWRQRERDHHRHPSSGPPPLQSPPGL